jgi:tetratricopeptide (TPR) repeat protein
MVSTDKPIADKTGESRHNSSRRARAVKLPALVAAIVVALGTIADLSGVYDVVGRIWPRQIQPMSGDINVLYVPFTSDRTVAEELETMVNESYAGELQRRLPRELDELTKGDSKYNVQVRVLQSLDLESNSSSVERVELYQQIIHDHGADIVLSGHLADTGKLVSLQSHAFISEGPFEGAAELAGMHYLHLSGTRVGPERSPEGRRRIRAQFVDQIGSYVRFIAAISLYTYGDNHAAVSGLERVRNEWSLPPQRKVVDVFLGNAWGRLNDDMKAHSYYTDATSLDPSYGRAYLGLAEIDYQRGHGGCQRDFVVYDIMERNISKYNEIFQAASSDELSDTQDLLERAAFGRGRAELCLALATLNADRFARASDDFSFAIDRFNDGKNRLRPLAAESHANRGLSLLSQKSDNGHVIEQYKSAAEEYRTAIFLTRDEVRQSVFYGMLGYIESQWGGSAARSCYLKAKELDPGRANEYDEALARLDKSKFQLPCEYG